MVLPWISYRPPLFAKKFKSYAKNELLLCSRNTVTTSRSRISIYLNEYEVVTVLRDAKMCSTSERYSKNIGAQRSPIHVKRKGMNDPKNPNFKLKVKEYSSYNF